MEKDKKRENYRKAIKSTVREKGKEKGNLYRKRKKGEDRK